MTVRAEWEAEALETLAGVRALAAEYGEPDPTPEAVALTEQVIRALAAHADYPKPHVCCSADGGVGVSSWRKNLMVFIETHNANEDGAEGVVFCVSNKKEWPKAVEAEPERFAEYAADVARFLLKGTPVPWERETE